MRRAARILLLSLALLALNSGTAAAHDSALHAPAPPSVDPAPAHEDTIHELNVDFAGIVARSASAMATTSAAALPVMWCGDERTTDDTANAVHAGSLPQFKLVYAYPSDRANRFAQWKDSLQANVSLIGQFVAQQSGGRKAPRWDMGTRCGPQYADITVVRLPRTRAVYAENFGEVANDVTAALGTSACARPWCSRTTSPTAGRTRSSDRARSPHGGRLVLALRNPATTLRDGRYRLRACAGRTCTTKILVVRRHRAMLPRTTLPSSTRVFIVELVGKGVRARARASRR